MNNILMTDEEREIQEMLIKHRGRWDQPKNHEIRTVHITAIVTIVITTIIWIILIATNNEADLLKKQAITLGYATRDPITLQFKWN